MTKLVSLSKVRIIDNSRRINTVLTGMVLDPPLVLQRTGNRVLSHFHRDPF